MAPDLTPHALDDGDVLYATPTREYHRLLQGTVRAIQVLAVALLVITGGAVIWALVASERSDGALFAVFMVIPALGSLLLLALTPRILRTLHRTVFVVTTEGLTLTPLHESSRYVPWDEVDHLAQEESSRLRGALVVETTDGERITATGTGPASAISFAPLPALLAPNGRDAPAPHVAAHAALDLYRSGAFHR